MIRKGRKEGTLRFYYAAENGVRQVGLAGSFNNWQAVRMRPGKKGVFAVTIPLEPGVYEYKFVADGQWVEDPDNSQWALNDFGTMNSVLAVEG
jgi:1,4-alpha-glucan branching enzyme